MIYVSLMVSKEIFHFKTNSRFMVQLCEHLVISLILINIFV